MTKKALILTSHGSRDPKWALPFKRITTTLRQKTFSGNVYLAYLEINKPLLKDLLPKLAKRKISRINVLPLFMSSGKHSSFDIPELILRTKKKFPKIRIKLLKPIGNHPELISSMTKIIKQKV